MENLIKQISTIISRFNEENNAQTTRVVKDRKFSSRRTRSSKGDSWKGENRRRSQLSRETSREYDKTEGEEFRTAVAAAAFVVSSMENKEHEMKQELRSNSRKNRKTLSEILEVSPIPKDNEDVTGEANHPTPTVVKTEDNEKLSGIPKDNEDLASESNQPTPTVVKTKDNEKLSKEIIDSVGPIAKTPSFVANVILDEKASRKEPETRLGEADIWETTEMEKIKERFVNLKAKIFEWEKRKKSKAKNKLTRKEGKLEWKRARALQDYKVKLETIEKISNGAISQNDKNRRKEEIRVKEKAIMIRSTGKIPKPTCLCC